MAKAAIAATIPAMRAAHVGDKRKGGLAEPAEVTDRSSLEGRPVRRKPNRIVKQGEWEIKDSTEDAS